MNERIKEVRKALKMTQADFGKKMNLTNNYIYLLESGAKPISDNFIFLLCTTYNVNKEWLETGDGDMFMPTTREMEIAQIALDIFQKDKLDPEADKALIDLIKIVSKMDVEQLSVLLSVAKNFDQKKDILD